MKKVKAMLFAVAIVVLGTSAFAQPNSNTKASTAGLFSNDIDYFMDVNDWSLVEPKNLFGFLGYGNTGNSVIQFGVAHQFTPVFTSLYFEGVLPSFVSTKTDNTTVNQNNVGGSYNVGALFGFGNIGVRYIFGYNAYNDNNKTLDNGKKVSGLDHYDVLNMLSFGMNIEGKFALYPRADIGFDSYVNKAYTSADDFTDDSTYALIINAGTGIDFPGNEVISHNLDVELDTIWGIFPAITSKSAGVETKVSGQTDIGIDLVTSYTMTVTPVEKLALKFGITLDPEFTVYNDGPTTIDGIKNNVTTTSDFYIYSGVNAGMQFYIKPNFSFNTGISVAMPNFGWETVKDEATNTNTTEFDINGSSFGLT